MAEHQFQEQFFIDEPFFGGREIPNQQREKQIQSIEQQLNLLQNVFEWLDQEQIYDLKRQINERMKPDRKVKYIIGACLFNLIKKNGSIRQDLCNQMLLQTLNLKQKRLLEYLRLFDQHENIQTDLLPSYHDKMRKYFYGAGQVILLTLKQPGQKYQELIESIIDRNNLIIKLLLQLQAVKQYCLSKKPSRLIINIGYFALQLQRINIIYGDYSRLFNVSINSLRYFTKGLLQTIYTLISKMGYVEIEIKQDKTQSQTLLDGEEKSSEQSFEYFSDGHIKQLQMVREFVEDFSFIMIDTKEEDDIFDEFQEIMNL
ncbi:hypothetical protein pb186bvf_019381 [Paramecium bursaria]